MTSIPLQQRNDPQQFSPVPHNQHSHATRLASLSHNHVALLHSTAEKSTVNIIRLTSYNTPPKPPINVPTDAHTLLPSRDTLAVIGNRSLTVIDHPLSPCPSTRRIASPLFQSRPALTITYAAWAPNAPAFILILTSDSTLRLYDVVSRDDVTTERLRLRVVTNACSKPVCFAFGRSSVSWDALSVYVLTEDGEIYVVAPLAPIGTRLPFETWSKMRAAALARKEHTADSWPARQADMQLRFLDHVFERGSSPNDMIAVREFKPAHLLFQGPLFIEHDDSSDENSTDQQPGVESTSKYKSLTVLNCGIDVPPVLLRVSDRGDISVLVAVESLEPQWFLSAEASVTDDPNDDVVTSASDEYATCAAQVAPSLLCFEHVSLNHSPLSIVPFGSATHADVVFAATPSAVYSLRLSFVAALTDASALERSPSSVVSRILSTESLGNETLTQNGRIVGLVSHFARMTGPVALALTADCRMHTTAPLRWISHIDSSTLPPSISPPLRSTSSSSVNGGRKFACAELGKEATYLLKAVVEAERRAGGVVSYGTLGIAGDSANSSRVLQELERRVVLYTGGSNGSNQKGVSDCLGELSSVLSQWAVEVAARANDVQVTCVGEVAEVIAQVAVSEAKTRKTLGRVSEVGNLLEERMRALVTVVDASKVDLSPAEKARLQKLRDQSRRLAFYRGRIKELAAAIQASSGRLGMNGSGMASDTGGSPMAKDTLSMSAGKLGPIASPSASPFRQSSTSRRLSFAGGGGIGGSGGRSKVMGGDTVGEGPLARRRPEWIESWTGRPALNSTDTQRIRVALEKHSQEIAQAMEMECTLRKKLSVS